jgi:hypothetical protein
MKGLILIKRDDIHDVVATKKARLFNTPGSKIPQKKVANKAKCNSVDIPAKLILSLFL